MDAKTTLEILRRGRAYVEKGWTQNLAAQYEDGYRSNEVDLTDHGALASVCMLGGIRRASVDLGFADNTEEFDALTAATRALRDATGGGAVIDYNDVEGRTKDEVLARFDEAIKSLESK